MCLLCARCHYTTSYISISKLKAAKNEASQKRSERPGRPGGWGEGREAGACVMLEVHTGCGGGGAEAGCIMIM